ncbi:hypothetical protein [Nocardia mexicana]|uniref:DUF3558 domain-containing protein n=1 Tax=Nocardia mexicana TaxID=279262 RepID=A0A370HAG6_9NOCA|nr:hypothetical protein [Nocardia mexicana]RDI53939.1 hypothetical protein DFR68_10259 [Nocardia mexicana]
MADFQGGYLPPSPRPTGGRTGLIVAGVLGSVVVLGLGVVIGVLVSNGDGESATAPATFGTSPAAATTTTSRPAPAPGNYSTSGIANACDLVDPTPLHRWSSTPREAPVHRESPPNTSDGGNLYCAIRFNSPSTVAGDTTVDEAGIGLQAEITGAAGTHAYDRWRQTDTATTRAGRASGEVTGIGSQAYWHTSTTDTGNAMTYIVGAQDSNASVRVEVAVLRAAGEPPLNRDELGTIAENQARRALDGLRRP